MGCSIVAQTLSALNIQSPEVTSKAAPPGDELNDSVKALSEKLSEALLNIRSKEDLVKQHAKVAEEAVSGWERAENEVSVLKKQNDALAQKNSILEERVGHLDGALKECLRQLRQAREEQEEKIYEAVAKKGCEWESKMSELQNKLVELHAQLQSATDADKTMLAEVRSKLDAAEKENSTLKLKLLSKAEELELRTSERDLSTRGC
ncbi:UNVERIFIED_CONTAM: Filament-like plant protein 3 [Sesamum radiatum]|uniref:Filament-like plant protein 3 n=1 Tax=Sesamum radiatum TaxID=300843 RepID=A0AAW2V4J7_SESRA